MKRRLFGLFIALIFAMQMLVGCSGGDPTPSGKIYPDTLPEYTASDDKVMFIGGFAKPRVMTLEAYQDIADCGIEYILIDPWFAGTNINNEAQICRALELCEQAGIKGFIMPNNTHEVEDASTYVSFEDFSVDYKQYPAFAGFYAFDEPSVAQFDWIKQDYAKYKEFYQGYPYAITLMGGDYNHNLDEYWSIYCSEVLSTFGEESQFIEYDCYPLLYDSKLGYNHIADSYLSIMETVTYYSQKYNFDLYGFLQTLGYGWGAHREIKSVQDIRWQVAMSMVFGNKGINCFTYSSVKSEADGWTDAMITAAGEKTDTWYYCQQVFSEIRQWQEVYLSFDYEGYMVYDSDAKTVDDEIKNVVYNLKSHDRIKNYSSTRDMLIGTFEDENGYDGFLFATYNDPYYQKYNEIHVEFRSAKKAVVYFNGERSVVELNNGVFDYEIGAGDILFVIPVA